TQEIGKEILKVDHLTKAGMFKNLSFNIEKGQKVAFFAKNSQILTALFNIILGIEKPDHGQVFVGKTIKMTNLPQNNNEYFEGKTDSIVDWLRQFSKDQNETYIRSWLGRMLFTGEENLKPANVLSGGERVRCMLAKMMLEQGNLVILDEPTNHLDLESITALNKGMQNFRGNMLFATHDQEIIETVANRIIDIVDEDKIIDFTGNYQEYIEKYGK
ncbi:MAG: ABC-F family ATP-binding cassette domain-containing protein, partial [Clostridia bacterium]|nr:ABC-F family ATP-binding cassette domain-containing protein [Clostridia bacterium]